MSDKKKCAKWCGRGCTQAEYDAAHEAGRALAERLGSGWKPQVWENLGWHYCVISRNGFIKVHPFFDHRVKKVTSYTAFIGEKGAGGRWAEYGKTPIAAIRKAAKRLFADLEEMNQWVKDVP